MPTRRVATQQNRRSRWLFIFITVIFVGICAINIQLVVHLDTIIGANDNNANTAPSSIFAATNNAAIDPLIQNQNNNAASDDDNRIIEYFRQAGVELDEESVRSLPTWSQIEDLIGDEPVVLGLDRCADFRKNVPPLRRMLGSAGMFNSGTNLVTRLMKENCVIPERFKEWGPGATKEQYGIRWQCAWGKHTPVKFKYNHTAPHNEDVNRDDCLPIVTARNPYDWMTSMCKHPYTAKWSKGKTCPHLLYENSKVSVKLQVKLAEQWLNFSSLAHLWNEWYAQYWRDADFPFLMVRFEDLIFRQYDTTKIICNCAGGEIPAESTFKYIVNSAKQGPGHGKDLTGMVEAWSKYGKPKEVKAGFSDADWEASLKFLSHELMGKLKFKYPPSE